MKEKVLCCPDCGDYLLMDQRAVLKGSNWFDGFCENCLYHVKLDKAVWKEV